MPRPPPWTAALVLLAVLAPGGASKPCVGMQASQQHKLNDHPYDDANHGSTLSWTDAERLYGPARAARVLQQAHGQAADAGDSTRQQRQQSRSRCRLTHGEWCFRFERQASVPFRPTPRGSKDCPMSCTVHGNCNHDTGVCECPAGWQGPECDTPLKRPCTNRYRKSGNETTSHIDANGRDLNLLEHGWMASRCGGICDDTIAACFCDGKYREVMAPPQERYGTPPSQMGRMLGDHCDPSTTKDGKATSWGNTPWEDLYGPQGWCESAEPRKDCGCMLDGRGGRDCDKPYEAYCLNQCTGHGVCVIGFCKCDDGWYGVDCSRKKAGMEMEPGRGEGYAHWLRLTSVMPPAAVVHEGASAKRKRPFIYVYDMPPEFTTRMLQYRVAKRTCTWRVFDQFNSSEPKGDNVYSFEPYFYETMLQSEHRTFDPEEADFFYVPALLACLFYPVFGWADYPWYYGPLTEVRPLHAANMLVEVKKWLQQNHPYWDRRGGRDHIFVSVLDEGACWFPSEVYNTSIVLTHWGRTDLDHQSNTAYHWDNYSRPMTHPEWQPKDWRLLWQGHPCYTPGKDLVVPTFKPAHHYRRSPLLGAPPKQRDILLFFAGDTGEHRLAWYSREIRQKLHQLANTNNWRSKYNVFIGTTQDVQQGQGPDAYSDHLTRSKFCLVAPGDGWSARAEDAVLHGCIPLIIMDGVHSVFESILEYDAFALRVNERSLRHVVEVLLAIPDDRIARMQKRLTRVWHRFAYTSGPFARLMFDNEQRRWQDSTHEDSTPEQQQQQQPIQAVVRFPHQDDAFHTIMQWLYHKIPDTR